MLLLEDHRDNTPSAWVVHKGGALQVQVAGLNNGVFTPSSLNNIIVEIETRQDSLPPFMLTSGRFIAPDVVRFNMAQGTQYRASVSGAASDFGVTVSTL